ncbi:hypothetical protein DAPPUDRAFT_266424 [Daphnia pulex]|uniref:RNase H type-1 domain-containing protein n=1 Tax=Daphnia pulex TaxID=6669 RepID=E9HV07_DAPPU|nr:hypothetical protein DAPPUDRAFT_266424 [Daphnia pulex]|eukprot:EFX64418.1 hypothetical protein DAPPUDRAFT_266424 [Daphnia pulex]
MGSTILADIDLFQAEPEQYPHLQERPPWKEPPIAIRYFPLSKQMSMNNPSEARALFNQIKHNHFNASTIAYTDGSLNKSTGKTTSAVIIPSLNIEEATTLSRNSSVFTVEAEAINRTLELVYHLDDEVAKLTIFSDSRSVVQSIESPKKEKYPIINAILTTADNLKSAGTKINLYWIPSHVGIPGNGAADRLASEESNQLFPSRSLKNFLSSAEQAAVFKEYLRKININELHKGRYKDNTHTRTKTGALKWHSHKSRNITRVLFKLRTGHNRLKANLARFNNQLDPTCQFCEDEDESKKHVLLEYPAFELERQEINSYFTTHSMEHNLCNLLGLNPTLKLGVYIPDRDNQKQ